MIFENGNFLDEIYYFMKLVKMQQKEIFLVNILLKLRLKVFFEFMM
jgi:hypothetical protein